MLKCLSGNINEWVKKQPHYNLTMIMLIRTFRHVEVQLTEWGNSRTINSSVKHRLPPPNPSPVMCGVLRFKCFTCNTNESLKEKYDYNLTWSC